MTNLISGREALIALANGEDVQWATGNDFQDITYKWQVREFLYPSLNFRLKPKTISINGIKVPAPFEPKEGDVVWVINTVCEDWYDWSYGSNCDSSALCWRSEDEVKQVVEALRHVFGDKP